MEYMLLRNDITYEWKVSRMALLGFSLDTLLERDSFSADDELDEDARIREGFSSG
jgi:hypothetical protein